MSTNSQVGTYTYPTNGIRPHAVSTAGGNSYTYDNNGNMTGGAGRTITYDPENRPMTITKGGITTTFYYDGNGARIKKTSGGATTIYIGKLYECTNGICDKFIFANGQRIARKTAGTNAIMYYHSDHLGSSSVVTDGNGAQVENLAYYPYGQTRIDSVPGASHHKYTDQELDAETGLYFYNARYYDPALGRFISADSIIPDPSDPQAFNRYSYVRNNPINLTDPSGHSYCDDPNVFCNDGSGSGGGSGPPSTTGGGPSNEDFWECCAIGGCGCGSGRGDVGNTPQPTPISNSNYSSNSYYVDYTNLFSNGYAGANGMIGGINSSLSDFFDSTAMRAMQQGDLLTTGVCALGDAARQVFLPQSAAEVPLMFIGGVGKVGSVGKTVLGKYPDYINLADKIGARKFNIPSDIWNKMSKTEQWAANQKFLDRAISRGDDILLSNPVKNINNVSGAFHQELDYLMKNGYNLSVDGTKMIK